MAKLAGETQLGALVASHLRCDSDKAGRRLRAACEASKFQCVVMADSVTAAAGAWGVVNTQPRRERIALENLARQAFKAWCPLVRRRVRHARGVHEVLRPLFPGYLFVHLSPQTPCWRPIMSTSGVRMLVRFGEQPAFIADDFIQELRSHEIDGEIVRPADAFTVGQRVHVADGPFGGLVGTVFDVDDKDRLVVLMNVLSRTVKVQVAAGMVAPA
jgi:transcriptional antiterminator RfaH